MKALLHISRKLNMIKNYLIILCVIGGEKAFIGATSSPLCWDFDTSSEWFNNHVGVFTFDWKFTADNKFPDDTNIPSFMPYTKTMSYTWLQDQDTPPQEGELQTYATLNEGDVLSITIFRHILQGKSNDSARPVLRFTQTDTSPQRTINLAYSAMYDDWRTVEAFPCGQPAQGYTACCASGIYPCTGYLQIDGEVLIRDELLAVDKVELNGGCTSPTPSPRSCDCDFEGESQCTWQECSWTYGTSKSIPPSPDGGNYMFTGSCDTQMILRAEVSDSSTFSFDYYFNTSSPVGLYLRFVDEFGIRHAIPNTSYSLPNTRIWANTGPLTCSTCCPTGSSCFGLLEIEVGCLPPYGAAIAVDGFVGNFESCPATIPNPETCYSTFDTDSEDWSVFYISNGWLWTGYEPSSYEPPSPSGSDFVYIHNTAAKLIFPTSLNVIYLEITKCTEFSFNYYLSGASDNYMMVYFNHTSTGLWPLKRYFPTSQWTNTGPIRPNNHMPPYMPPCEGQIIIETTVAPKTNLDAAIDDFVMSGIGYKATYCP